MGGCSFVFSKDRGCQYSRMGRRPDASGCWERQRWEGRAVDWVRNKAGTFDSLTLARDPSYLSIQRISQRDGKEAAIRTREKAELVETEDENEEK